MTDNNSMGKIEYIFSNIFWSFITMIWYRSLLFIPLNDYTVGTSKKVLWTLIATMVLIGMLITFKKRRNYLSLVINILFPFEIYAIASYWNFFNTGYATQYCERHADAYADDAVESYYKAIFEYETKGE